MLKEGGPFSPSPILATKGITKSFYGNKVLDNVDFSLYPGEIHVILGENGAGKSTFIKILAGIYTPDSGEIYIKGRRVSINSSSDAIKHGLALVNQYPQLIEELTIAENIALSLPKVGLIKKAASIGRLIAEVSRNYGFKLSPNRKVSELSFSEKQRVEIIKALLLNAEIILMDEPTTLLTSAEKKLIYRFMRKSRAEGKSILHVTHKIPEALEIADRITILRRGRVVSTMSVEEASYERIIQLMFSEENLRTRGASLEGRVDREDVLAVDSISVLDDYGRVAVSDVSFKVKRGEIYGIAGVAGNGQIELVESIYGLRELKSGSIYLLGKRMEEYPREEYRRLVGYVPDRTTQAVILNMTLLENFLLKHYRSSGMLRRGGLINYATLTNLSKELMKDFMVYAKDVYTNVGSLSGGNVQKLIIAREVSINPILLIAVNPTRSLDYLSTEYFHGMLRDYANRGGCVLLVSEDLEEVIKVSDTVAVMYEGRLYEIGPRSQIEVEDVEAAMVGKLRRR